MMSSLVNAESPHAGKKNYDTLAIGENQCQSQATVIVVDLFSWLFYTIYLPNYLYLSIALTTRSLRERPSRGWPQHTRKSPPFLTLILSP